MDDTETVAVYAESQTLLAVQILWEFQNFASFERFCWNSDQNSQNVRKIRGIPVRLTEHLLQDFQSRPWGSVDIFWNSPLFCGPSHTRSLSPSLTRAKSGQSQFDASKCGPASQVGLEHMLYLQSHWMDFENFNGL